MFLDNWRSWLNPTFRVSRHGFRPRVEHLETRLAPALTFNLIPAAGMSQQAIAGFQEAANLWKGAFSDDITVNININFTSLPTGVLAATSPATQSVSMTDLRGALTADRSSAFDASAVAHLPTGSTVAIYTSDPNTGAAFLDANGSPNNTLFDVTTANAKALGITPARQTASDGSISFSNQITWDFDRSNGITAGALDFVGSAAHEIGHVLGFSSGADRVDVTRLPNGPDAPTDLDPETVATPLDLFRYSADALAAGANFDVRADTAVKFFSINGGATSLAPFSTGQYNGDGQQASHWKDLPGLGIMDPTEAPGELAVITALDIEAFDVIGWNVGTTTVALNGPKNLIVTDIGAKNDSLTISLNGAKVRVHDPDNILAARSGAIQVNSNTVDVPLASITGPLGIVVNTLGGDDTLAVDFASGNPIPTLGGIRLRFNSGAGNDTLTLANGNPSPSGRIHFNGGVGSDTFVGSDLDNTWTITATNAGSIASGAGSIASFAGIENLTGGSARDVFRFGANGNITGAIDGGAGSNWLDYSVYSGSVIVNLATGVATRITGGVKGFDNVIGGANGISTLIGNDNGGVLIGKGKANTIAAGAGRSLLIGGYGVNTLIGGAADDLLINGRTSYDGNFDALDAILAIWQNNAQTYAQRIAALQAAGPNQLAIGTTVFIHPGQTAGGIGPRFGSGNFVYQSNLVGNAGSDWFITKLLLTVIDREAGEEVTAS